MDQSPNIESSAESGVLFRLLDADFTLFRWNEDPMQSVGYRATPVLKAKILELRRENQEHLHLTFGAATVEKDVTISIPLINKFEAGDLGLSSISPRDILLLCQDVKPSVPGSYTLAHEERVSDDAELVGQDPFHYFLLKFSTSLLRTKFLQSFRQSLSCNHGAKALQCDNINFNNSKKVVDSGNFTVSTDSAGDATLLSGNASKAADPGLLVSSTCTIPAQSDNTTAGCQADIPSPIVLSRKRKRWNTVAKGGIPEKRDAKRCMLKAADYEDLVDDVVRYAQIHGCQNACNKFAIEKNELHNRIFRIFSKNGRYSIVNRDVCPSDLATGLLEDLNTRTTFSLQDVVDKAKELLESNKNKKRFHPSINWAARFVIHHDLRKVELDGDDILALADFPLLPPSDIFKTVKSGMDVLDSKWELRKTIVDYAEKTTLRIASELFAIPKSTISEWRNKLESVVGTELPCGSGRKISYSKDMDRILLSWLVQESQQGRKATIGDLQKKAKDVIGKEIPEFRASRGWVTSFCRRHKVKFPVQNSDDARASKCFEPSIGDISCQSDDLECLNNILNELLYDHCWTEATS